MVYQWVCPTNGESREQSVQRAIATEGLSVGMSISGYVQLMERELAREAWVDHWQGSI